MNQTDDNDINAYWDPPPYRAGSSSHMKDEPPRVRVGAYHGRFPTFVPRFPTFVPPAAIRRAIDAMWGERGGWSLKQPYPIPDHQIVDMAIQNGWDPEMVLRVFE